MACEGCQSAVAAGELGLSGAGQWLCRSCLAHYTIETDKRRLHDLQIYRRCRCGAEIGPADEVDVPLYHQHNGEDGQYGKSINLGYAFRSTVYSCSCGRRFTLLHPVLALVPVVVMGICLWRNGRAPMHVNYSVNRRHVGEAEWPFEVLVLIALAVFLGFGGPQLYYRWRYPRVR